MSHIGNMRYKSSEAWSFGSGSRARTSHQGVPGPGQYNVGKDIREPRSNIPIGTAKRNGLNNPSNTPGPGTYRDKTSIGIAPAFSMVPRRGQGATGRMNTPGPGTYRQENNTLPDNPRYTFGLKPDVFSSRDKEFPGPGTYNYKDDLKREGVGSKFGTGQRGKLSQVTNTPGPGNYKHLQTTGEGPKFGFGSSTRMGRPQSASGNYAPGPGQYNMRSSIQNDKGITMTPRRPDSSGRYRSQTPGPGTYAQKGNPKE